jgi:hypothetical protein
MLKLQALLLFAVLPLALAGCDGDTTVVVATGRPPSTSGGSGEAGGGFLIVAGSSGGQRSDAQPARRPPEPRILESAPAASPQGVAIPVPALSSHARGFATLLLVGIGAWHQLVRRAGERATPPARGR